MTDQAEAFWRGFLVGIIIMAVFATIVVEVVR